VAFIYLTGGQVLRVAASREAIANDLLAAGSGKTLDYRSTSPPGRSSAREGHRAG
jgi:hypothetical protein